MAIDGNYDGKVTIKSGQGIIRAIKDELGLTAADCKKLDGSIWTQITAQIAEQNKQGKIYDGGDDLSGASNKNFVVHAGDEIQFSKNIWNNIVQIINDKLGTNIKKLDTSTQSPATVSEETTVPPKTTSSGDATASTVDRKPPVSDSRKPAFVDVFRPSQASNMPIADCKQPWFFEPKNDSLAGKTLTDSDGKKIVFDQHGRKKYIYDNKGLLLREINRASTEKGYSDDGLLVSYTDYEYDANGNKTRKLKYDYAGLLQSCMDYERDKQGRITREIERNPDGTVKSYIDYELNERGQATREIYRNPDGSIEYYVDVEFDANGKWLRTYYRNPDGTER